MAAGLRWIGEGVAASPAEAPRVGGVRWNRGRLIGAPALLALVARWIARALVADELWDRRRHDWSGDYVLETLIDGLGAVGGLEAIPVLLDYAGFYCGGGPILDAPAHGALIRLVERLGPATGDSLLEAARSRTGKSQLLAVKALGELREPRAVEVAIEWTRSPEGPLRAEATRTLGRIGDPRAIAPLVTLAERGGHGAEFARAAWALEDLLGKPATAVPAVILERVLALPEASADVRMADIIVPPEAVTYRAAKERAAAELARRRKGQTG